MTSYGEISSGPKPEHPHRRRLLAFAAAAAIGGVTGGLVVNYVDSQNTSPVHASGLSLAQVQTAEQLAKSAYQVAGIYESHLNSTIKNPAEALPVDTLRGVVTYRRNAARNGMYPQFKELHDPIVLSWDTGRTAEPVNDNLLDGAWLAFQSDDAQGDIEVEAIPFNKQTMHFQPNSQVKVVFQTPVLQAIPVKDGAGSSEYTAVAVPLPGQSYDMAHRPGLLVP